MRYKDLKVGDWFTFAERYDYINNTATIYIKTSRNRNIPINGNIHDAIICWTDIEVTFVDAFGYTDESMLDIIPHWKPAHSFGREYSYVNVNLCDIPNNGLFAIDENLICKKINNEYVVIYTESGKICGWEVSFLMSDSTKVQYITDGWFFLPEADSIST